MAFFCAPPVRAQQLPWQPATPARAAAMAVNPTATPAASELDALKVTLDAIEQSFSVDAQNEDELDRLKRRLAPLRDQLRDRLAGLDPQLRQTEQRLAQLGPPPGDGAAEDATISSERSRLNAQRAEVEGALKQAQLLADRADDLDGRINTRRRELFTGRLFAHSGAPFDPAFWRDFAAAAALEISGIGGLMNLWAVHVRSNIGTGELLGGAATLVAIAAAFWFLLRWERRLVRQPLQRRFDKAMIALLVLCAHAAKLSLLVVGVVLVLRNGGLMPAPISDLGFGLAAAVAFAGFGRGVAMALFAPGESGRRIVAWTDREAAGYAAHLTWASRVFGIGVFLNIVHRTLGSPVAPLILTGEVFAFAMMAIGAHLLWRSAQSDFREPGTAAAGAPLPWFRGVFWLIAVVVATALATGYVGFAVFVVGRLFAALAISGALAIIIVFLDALLTEVLAGDTPYGRRIAALFGLSPRGLDLIETLVSAVLRIVLVVLAVLLVLGYSGVFADDVFVVFQQATWNYVLGGINLSPTAVLSALALVAIGGLMIRRAQGWLQTKFLPRTGLDAGLQNSVLSLFGYVALIAIGTMALAALGIDLQKIALIAGALSVGIGFGLQSVVSNFVSGLILLAERPIRVGDWVVVKNEEGWVRRISVRATEIETFDRASVIIPNQEFITGVVKNWTHGNTMGRLVIKVRVAYDSDPVAVRGILLACAEQHAYVLKAPPPAVYLMAFGDIGLDFELRCLLGNVEQLFVVRNDLHMDILRRFRDAGVKIPFPVHDAGTPGLPLALPAPPTRPPADT